MIVYIEIVLRKAAGYLVAFCGAALLFPGLGLDRYVVKRKLPPGGGLVQIIGWQLYRLLFMALSPIMTSMGGSLFITGLKIKTIPADKLLEVRKDAPVLYLRSFELDRNRQLVARSQEETLARVLRSVGPCIAVSDPRTHEVFLGFSRLRLGADWKEKVAELITRSKLVIHCTGGTEGLLWELRQVAEVKPRSKLVLLVTETVTDEWWQVAKEVLGIQRLAVVRLGFKFSYRELIYFDDEGVAHNHTIYEVARPDRALLEDALDPVLHQMGIRPRPKLVKWLSDPAHTFILLFSAVLLFLLLEVVLRGLGIGGS